MISRAGISIFLFGNKLDTENNIIEANGVLEEYEIAKSRRNLIIPVGCTGYVARKIWEECSNYNTNDLFKKLNEMHDNMDDLINVILEIILKSKN